VVSKVGLPQGERRIPRTEQARASRGDRPRRPVEVHRDYIIPIGEAPIASITGDTNTSSGYFCRISKIQVLHETEPPDETRLIGFLGVIERFVELAFRQMLTTSFRRLAAIASNQAL